MEPELKAMLEAIGANQLEIITQNKAMLARMDDVHGAAEQLIGAVENMHATTKEILEAAKGGDEERNPYQEMMDMMGGVAADMKALAPAVASDVKNAMAEAVGELAGAAKA